ncbi:FAS1 domain-containing protein [Mariannaea sp. PMI_226]|nr:FAS1 domain-containing protein [Mariannaea sp. PMI_226]
MRFITPLTLATAASAMLIPPNDAITALKEKVQHEAGALLTDAQEAVSFSVDEVYDSVSAGAHAIQNAKKRVEAEISSGLNKLFGHDGDYDSGDFNLDTPDRDFSESTIYELIAQCNETKKFFEIVNRYDDIVKLLNDTKADLTLFLPTDHAFERLPPHKKPSDELIKKAIQYHIGKGSYPARRILSTHTLPTEYNEDSLGGKPQRLRTSVGFSGVRINVYSKVIVADFKAKNGIIHAVDHVLVPPPPVGLAISFFPSEFSTLLLAYEKTDFVKYVHSLKFIGSTVFAPSNKAWKKLGPAANAFLFNTEEGKKHLNALLKYQIVPNTTVYSDEIYFGDKGREERVQDLLNEKGHFHIQLPTLLSKEISVDIYNWKLWTSIVLNGAVGTSFVDGVGKNGVLHVVEEIPVPHGKAGDEWMTWDNIEVSELKRRLKEFVESDEKEKDETPSEL